MKNLIWVLVFHFSINILFKTLKKFISFTRYKNRKRNRKTLEKEGKEEKKEDGL